MKKISLSVAAILFAASTIMATATPVKHAKKAKQETCTGCTKTNCTKDCNNKADCNAKCCTKN